MRSQIKQLITSFIGWPLSIAAIYFIIQTFLPKYIEILQLTVNLNLYLFFIGIVCFFIYYLLRSIIWHKIIGEFGYDIPYSKSAYNWASSEFKRYIPGNIWSFIGRSVLFTNLGIKKSHLAKSMFYEIQFVLIGAILASLLSIPFINLIQPFKISSNLLYLAIFSAIIFIIIYIFNKQVLNLTKGKFYKLISNFLPQFSAATNLICILLNFVAFLFFGFGYYLCISSIISLNPTLFFVLSGFFVFSLLVGLFSFITPTGLGVREGVIAYGLRILVKSEYAGFASIVGRISLISAEIIFLITSGLYSQMKPNKIQKFEKYINHNKFQIIVLLMIIAFNLYFIPVSFLRYDNFYTGRFDLGNMSQTVWNTKYGRIFQFTNPDGVENISRLAFHADIILILLTPFYVIWENPKMLLLIQSVVVSFGAIFVYLLTQKVFESKSGTQNKYIKILGLALSFSYLMNPSLQWSILYDFHAVTFATTFLLAAFYFIYTKKNLLFVIFAIFAGITKEQVWISIGLMGLYLAIWNIKEKISMINIKNYKIDKEIILGLTVFLFSLFAFYYLIWHAIPNAAGSNEHFALSYFEQAADSPTKLVVNYLQNPFQLLQKLIDKDRVIYYYSLLEPLGYLPLFAIHFLIFPIVDIMLNLLGDRSTLYQIYYQYTAVITPFLFISAIFAIKNLYKFIINDLSQKISFLKNKSNYLPHLIIILIIISAIRGAYIYGPQPWSARPNIAMINKPELNKDYINKRLSLLPTKSSVSSSNNLGAHLSHRENLYTIPHATDSADYIALLIRPNSPQYETELKILLMLNPNYTIIAAKDNFTLFKNINK